MQPTPLIAALAIALAPLGVRSADVALTEARTDALTLALPVGLPVELPVALPVAPPVALPVAQAVDPASVDPASGKRSAPPESVAPPSTAWRALEAEAPAAWAFLRADGTVHQALQRWSREAGWQLVWEVERDFPIDAEVTLRGNFLDVLNQTMAALRDTDFPLQARIQAETRVVRIGRYLPDGARR